MRKVIVCLSVLIAFLSPILAADDVWTPEKIMLERDVGSAAFSPNGGWIAYTVREAVMEEEKSEFLTHIWISAADGSRTFQLTRGDKSCSSPAWSPDGKWIAFTTSRSGKDNIWLIHPFGGEAKQLTDVETGVGSFRWSPDGSEIAFLMSDPETETDKKAKKGKDDARIEDTNYKFSHIYRIKACTEEKAEPVKITQGDLHVTGFAWSPDGKSFVFSHQTTPSVNDWRTRDISLIPFEGGELKPLVRSEGMDTDPLFSPDGKTIVFVSDRGNLTWARHWKICLVEADGSEVRTLAETYDRLPSLVEWAPDGQGVYYSETFHTTRRLLLAPTDGGEHRPIGTVLSIVSDADISKDGSLLAFCGEDLESPPEVYTLPLQLGVLEPKQISGANAHLPQLPMAKSEVITWKSADGLEIEGILTYPLNYEEGKRYPLLLNIHGGPAGVFTRGFTAGKSPYAIQALAAKGFAVLRPNPRGSSGYGWEFRFANISDWGGGDYRDLMAGVDYVIEKGIADPDKLGVMGWSYGGFMTSWIITQTDRFKAAAVGAGVTDLVSFTGTTDIVGFIPSYFEGEMWERNESYRAHSAMFHIGNAVTPTLILHGENDQRVPIGQGYELYNALKRMGVEVQMVTYPRTPHGPREPKLLMDTMKRHIDYFSGKLLGTE
jgi:dipeptidyl aminopeptidase/acylaminoacyl peptidase